MITQEIIDIGSTPNNRKGDPIRIAFSKINNNFASLSLLDDTIILSPIDIELKSNDDAQKVLQQAFEITNQNFSNLSLFINDPSIVDLNHDTLRSAFQKINDNFDNLFKHDNLTTVDKSSVNFNFVKSKNSTFNFEVFDFVPLGSSQQIIDIGAAPNDGTGDPLRTAFGKINNNFANLFSTTTLPITANTSGNTANQVLLTTEITNFNQAQFTIRSTDGNTNSQNIILTAQISNDNTSVKFSAYGTTFFGNAVCTYDMDVVGSNVRILCNPFDSGNLTHVIFSQVLQLS